MSAKLFPREYRVPDSPHADLIQAAIDAGHPISVTETWPRWTLLCDCGVFGDDGRRYPSKKVANRAGLAHARDVTGRAS
jgi:hypothetical protein